MVGQRVAASCRDACQEEENMSRIALAAVVLAATLTVSGTAAAHGDHPIPTPGIIGVPSLTVNAGGPGATWEFVASIPTGNPHTDIDYFTRQGEIYAAVGTLGVGPNAGGQTIIRLTQNGQVSTLRRSSSRRPRRPRV